MRKVSALRFCTCASTPTPRNSVESTTKIEQRWLREASQLPQPGYVCCCRRPLRSYCVGSSASSTHHHSTAIATSPRVNERVPIFRERSFTRMYVHEPLPSQSRGRPIQMRNQWFDHVPPTNRQASACPPAARRRAASRCRLRPCATPHPRASSAQAPSCSGPPERKRRVHTAPTPARLKARWHCTSRCARAAQSAPSLPSMRYE